MNKNNLIVLYKQEKKKRGRRGDLIGWLVLWMSCVCWVFLLAFASIFLFDGWLFLWDFFLNFLPPKFDTLPFFKTLKFCLCQFPTNKEQIMVANCLQYIYTVVLVIFVDWNWDDVSVFFKLRWQTRVQALHWFLFQL